MVGSAAFDSMGFGAGSVSWAAVQDLPGQNPFSLYHSLLDAGGDVLAWAKVEAILNHSSESPTHLNFLKGTQDDFQALLGFWRPCKSSGINHSAHTQNGRVTQSVTRPFQFFFGSLCLVPSGSTI